MSCCVPTEEFFSSVSTTTIPYTSAMKVLHGEIPRVDVYYYNEETGVFDLSIHASKVALLGNPVNSIFIDHGGHSFSGFVKIT